MLQSLKAGFTLIEILVVVAIIGILVALLLPNMVGARARATDAQAKSNLNQFKSALRLHYNEHNEYPAGTDVSCIGLIDTKFIVADAIPASCKYTQIDGDTYYASILLNNTEGVDAGQSATRCSISSPTAGRYYVCAN
jgi:type IV pilus assembly protein PilA